MTATDAGWREKPSLADLWRDWRRSEPVFAGATLACLVACLPVLFAMGVDGRTVADVNVWVKPLKFLLSIASYFAALAWFARWLPEGTTRRPLYRAWAGLLVFCAFAEMVWIAGASAFGVASHFNGTTTLMAVAYSLAGIGAVTLLSGAPVYALLIRRRPGAPADPAFREAVLLGLGLTFPLTLAVAGYLASGSGHLVGGDLSDAQGMALSGWARDGGDLRVAHFFALHALHFIPAFGWLAARTAPGAALPAVRIFAAGYVALTAWVFIEALAGRPFLPFIP